MYKPTLLLTCLWQKQWKYKRQVKIRWFVVVVVTVVDNFDFVLKDGNLSLLTTTTTSFFFFFFLMMIMIISGDLDKRHWCIPHYLTQSSMDARTLNLGTLYFFTPVQFLAGPGNFVEPILFCIRMAHYSNGEAGWFSARTLSFHQCS